jgi:hypothetical protein
VELFSNIPFQKGKKNLVVSANSKKGLRKVTFCFFIKITGKKKGKKSGKVKVKREKNKMKNFFF